MRKSYRIGISLLATLFCCLLAGDTKAGDTGEKAVTYFQHKQYKEALSIWSEMALEGDFSAGLYYNIGLAESLLNNTPGAMLAYEKALRLNPGNALVRKAIEMERKKMENPTIPVEPFFVREWGKRLLTLLRPGYWAFLGMGLLLAGIIRFLLLMKRTTAKVPLNTQWPVIVAATGLLAVLTGLLSYREIYREDEAITTNARCEVRQAPTAESPLVRTIAPGEKVTITDHIGDWYNVNLLNLDAGWVKKENLVPIRIGKE